MSERILIVEDNDDVREIVQQSLKAAGYRTDSVTSGAAAIRKLQNGVYDLIILDLVLPDMKGESVCRRAKEIHPQQLVIMLTGKSKSQDVIHGFEVGADDYVCKPFDPDELLARIQARLRSIHPQSATITVGNLRLDTQRKTVHHGDDEISLTPQEYRMLEYLMLHADKTISRDMILNRLWSAGSEVESRVVDVYVGYLRNKIDKPYGTHHIRSIRGFGYMLTATDH